MKQINQRIQIKFKLYYFYFLFIFLHFDSIYSLKILTYNINCEINWSIKNKNIIKLLQELDADVICLQEVMDKDHAKHLAKNLKLFWSPNAWHAGGMTIFSKNKILRTLNIPIPNSYYNAFVAIKINPDLWIASIHLSSTDYKINDKERLREIKFILQKIKNLNAKRIIIAGDFNSLENSPVNSLIIKNQFIDSHKNKTWEFSTWMPSKGSERIDRIYFKGNFEILNGKVIDHNNLSWLKKIGWPSGNDHRLVMSELKLNN